MKIHVTVNEVGRNQVFKDRVTLIIKEAIKMIKKGKMNEENMIKFLDSLLEFINYSMKTKISS